MTIYTRKREKLELAKQSCLRLWKQLKDLGYEKTGILDDIEAIEHKINHSIISIEKDIKEMENDNL